MKQRMAFAVVLAVVAIFPSASAAVESPTWKVRLDTSENRVESPGSVV